MRKLQLFALASLVAAACSFDWDSFDPRLEDGAGGATSTGSGAAGASGGAGGSTTTSSGGAGGVGPIGTTWSKSFGDSATNQEVDSIAVDPSGNVLITGEFEGTINFGGSDLVSAGDTDAFIAKLDPDGAHLWSRSFGDTLIDNGRGIAVDSAGNVIVVGEFIGTVDLGTGPLVGNGGPEAYVLKLDPDGNTLCAGHYGASGIQRATSVAIDSADNIVITGQFYNTINFGNGAHTSVAGRDIFAAKLDPQCGEVWSQSWGTAGGDYAWSVAVDPQDNIALGTDSDAALDFGSMPPALGGDDVYVPKLDSGGSHQWTFHFGALDAQWAPDIAFDNAGALWMCGPFSNTPTVGGMPLTNAGGFDVYVIKLDASGTPAHAYATGDVGLQNCDGIATGPDNHVWLTGDYENTVDFGGSLLTSNGSTDAFLVRLDDSGAHQWSITAGAAGEDEGEAVAIGPDGSVHLGGSFATSIDFGEGTLTSAGGKDAFVVKLRP